MSAIVRLPAAALRWSADALAQSRGSRSILADTQVLVRNRSSPHRVPEAGVGQCRDHAPRDDARWTRRLARVAGAPRSSRTTRATTTPTRCLLVARTHSWTATPNGPLRHADVARLSGSAARLRRVATASLAGFSCYCGSIAPYWCPRGRHSSTAGRRPRRGHGAPRSCCTLMAGAFPG